MLARKVTESLYTTINDFLLSNRQWRWEAVARCQEQGVDDPFQDDSASRVPGYGVENDEDRTRAPWSRHIWIRTTKAANARVNRMQPSKTRVRPNSHQRIVQKWPVITGKDRSLIRQPPPHTESESPSNEISNKTNKARWLSGSERHCLISGGGERKCKGEI